MKTIKFIFKNDLVEIDFLKSTFTPNTTLLQFIRSHHDKKGTKEGCNEGDCGACTVVIAEFVGKNLKISAVNSCITLLPSVNGKQVITVEDLASEKLHPIQQYFIENFATQCGFCTPGFIMSAFAQKASNLSSKPQDIIEALSGNLCRCTGYKQIVDAAYQIAGLEYKDYYLPYVNIELLKNLRNTESVIIKANSYNYLIPKTLQEGLRLKKLYPNYTLAAGTTDIAVKINKNKETFYNIIDISDIEELRYIKEDEQNFYIGATTRIEELLEYSKQKFPEIYDYLLNFGSKQIRNKATVGGNIATASPVGDLAPVLFALQAKIKHQSFNSEKITNIDKFISGYRKTILEPDEIITEIIVPKLRKNQYFRAYKLSKRRKLDIASTSAAIFMSVENNIIKECKVAFGGMSAKTEFAQKTQQFLINKQFCEETFLKAAEILKTEFTPISDARASAEGRNLFAKNLLIKFYNDLTLKQ